LIGAKDVLVPAADLDLDSDPFANWAASASRRDGHFDIDSVSAKLRESALENNDDDEAGYLSNKADKADFEWVDPVRGDFCCGVVSPKRERRVCHELRWAVGGKRA